MDRPMYECPKCSSYDTIYVDSITEECVKCGYRGDVDEFQIPEDDYYEEDYDD